MKLALAILLTGLALAQPLTAAEADFGSAIPALPGNSLTNSTSMNGMRRDLAYGILANEKKLGSEDSTIISTRVEQKPSSSDLLIANWKEVWTVQRKGKQVSYVVSFEGRGKARGISYSLVLKS